jgi:predicted ATPase
VAGRSKQPRRWGADLVQPQTDVLELLGRLVGKSMVLAEEPGENEPNVLRYRFLETIREYAEEKLVDAGEADVARTRHRDWYLVLAERAMEGMEGAEQKSWWDRLELEHDNLCVAVRWSAADPSRSAAVLGFAGLLGRFWQTRDVGHIRWRKLRSRVGSTCADEPRVGRTQPDSSGMSTR